jgi:hypothetical protein
MKKKATCRIRNRSEYNASLKQGGRLTIRLTSTVETDFDSFNIAGPSPATLR